jgi:hypothetical protein
MTEYELRNHFLLVEAIDLRGEKVAGLKMNMFTLWTGPYHQDFALKIGKSGNCRISFNAKISQGVHLTISNTIHQVDNQSRSGLHPLVGGSEYTLLRHQIVTDPATIPIG